MNREKSEKHFRLAEILAAFHTGSQTPRDEKELQEWLDENQENRETANRILDPDNYLRNEELIGLFGVDDAWKATAPRLSATKERASLRKRLIPYAAALAVLVCLGTAFLMLGRAGRNDRSDVFSAGHSGAVLTLEDGSTQYLSESLTGDVTVIERNGRDIVFDDQGADYSSFALNQSEVAHHTIVTPRGMEYPVVLADGTKVFLNSESKLTFPVAFSEDVREVSLSGEAYFEVARDNARSFVIRAGGAEITVLGTSFNMRAYEDENTVVTTLVEGKVAVACQTYRVEINPGEQAVYTNGDGQLNVKHVDVSLFTSWRSGKFMFRGEPLENVMSYLARWYGFEYEFADEPSRNTSIGASLDRYDSMEPIIDMLRATGIVDVKQINGKLIISQK